MHIERDARGNLRTVKGNHGRSKPTAPSYYPPIRGDSGRAPKAPGPNRHPPPGNHDGFFPLPRDPFPLPTLDPPRNDARPPGKPSSSANPAHRSRPPPFDEKRGVRRRSRELYEEASREVSPDTGTEYPCTQSDLDACGGRSRGSYIRDAYGRPDHARMRVMFFAVPNRGAKVSIRQAALDIFQHNALTRTPSAEEVEAIDRLCIMIDNACHGFWSPDVVIKCFCDLDTVFFRGKLKGHVCITWAGAKEFGLHVWGQTETLGHGHGKALIQLNADEVFLTPGPQHEEPLNQSLATALHEMWLVSIISLMSKWWIQC